MQVHVVLPSCHCGFAASTATVPAPGHSSGPRGGCRSIGDMKYLFSQMMYAHLRVSSIKHPDSSPARSHLGSGSLPRPPRLGALPAVPRRPVCALALRPAVVRAGAAGGAPAAPLEVPLPARRRRGQSGGRHPARAAAQQAEHREPGAYSHSSTFRDNVRTFWGI